MLVDCINPAGDARVSHCNAELNGRNYRTETLHQSWSLPDKPADYLLGVPKGGLDKATIFLVLI